MLEVAQVIYVSEPDVINVRKVRELLPEGYELLAGDRAFSGTIPEKCGIILMRSATTVNSSIKEKFPNLQCIIRIGVGVDNIDMDFCRQQSIRVYNAPGANADAVSDYVVCMMLGALRRIFTVTSEDVTAWNRFKFTGNSMSAQSIGIVGFGNIGKLVYKKLQVFGCTFYAYDPFIPKEAFPEDVTYMRSLASVFSKSSIVTLHLPLLPETHHVIGEDTLKLLPEKSILINAARGGIVDEIAVAEATRDRGLVYVADTVEGEPTVRKDLLRASNIIITPHIARLTEEAEENVVKVAINNFLSGENREKEAAARES
jgi:phosphoglycerate dehydrogenase-like enzyme